MTEDSGNDVLNLANACEYARKIFDVAVKPDSISRLAEEDEQFRREIQLVMESTPSSDKCIDVPEWEFHRPLELKGAFIPFNRLWEH